MSLIGLRLGPRDLETELLQAEDEGLAIPDSFRAEAEKAGDDRQRIGELLDRFAALPLREGYPYEEPSRLDEIVATLPPSPSLPKPDRLDERMHGAWLGRACGCLLGKPVEGWMRGRIEGYLRDSGQWPLTRYIRGDAPPEVAARYAPHPKAAFIERIEAMPEDDDMNYTVIGLGVFEAHGPDFTPEHVALFWLDNLPILRTFTAERAAYRNLVAGTLPPASAIYRNPYREWIGAQIRADFWGYRNPGEARRAAEMAWRDACVSHRKNGIYGEMWSAAMNAAAFSLDDPRAVIEAGLAQVPPRSRLVEWVRRVMDWHAQGLTIEDAIERIHEAWDEKLAHHLIHTISNAAIVAAGLLWGEGDYGRSVCHAVRAGMDTDCNGATVGSIVGAMRGVPAEWSEPIRDTLETGVAGYDRVRISDLAARTLALVEAM